MKFNNPPFVLAFPGDMSGCGWHRVIRPLQILGRTGLATGRAEVQFPSDSVLKAMAPDIIVWQRQSDNSHLDIMDRYRDALPNTFFVFEIDDALSAVPEASWHHPYMTPNIDAKLAKSLTRMDAITVTTQDLADHMSHLLEVKIPVRVMPNMLGRDDYEMAFSSREEIRKISAPAERFRIGFGGGVSHAGDLALLNEVFTELKDEVEWFFLGMNPETPPDIKKTFFGGVTPQRYLPSLAAMNVDLIVAPLEDNLFNRCKSNLRLIESGACGYPVIATPIAPYMTDDPPVFAYCNTASDWIDSIRKFMRKPADERIRHGEKMRKWAKSRYDLDEMPNAERRLLGWLPDKTRIFKPRMNVKGSGCATVSTPEELKAAFETSEDILYIRPGSWVAEEGKSRLLASDLDVACGLTNDGGPWGFPSQNQFTHTETSAMDGINKAILDLKDAKSVEMAAVSGPMVLLRRSALDLIGLPPLDDLTLEVAILEWSCGAKARGLKVGLCPSVYTGVPGPINAPPGEAEKATLRITSRWPQNRSDDLALKSLREHLEIAFHRECYKALPPAQRNNYPAWTDYCDTRGPRSLQHAQNWEELQSRPTIETLNYPCQIDWEAHQDADWLFFVPRDSTLPEDYRQLLMLAIEENPNAEIIYGDHDYTLQNQARLNPDFKPNFDLHLLLNRDYITEAVAIRADVLEDTFQETIDESTLYARILDIIREHGRQVVAHCPRILATLPPLGMDAVVAHGPSKLSAVQEFTDKSGWGVTFENHPNIPLIRSTNYSARIKGKEPTITIIIPCKDNLEMLSPCIATILKITDYPKDKFNIVIMDNGSTRAEMTDYLQGLAEGSHGLNAEHPFITIVPYPEEYNWAAINNLAVLDYTDSEYLCFLNDDTRVMSACWLSEMVGAASLNHVGAVGARLIYPHGLLQHVGVVAQAGLTGHIHKGLPVNQPGTQAYAITSHECTAVTGACMVVSRKNFDLVGGFNLRLPTNFNDVAFCQDLYFKHGLKNVLAFKAELQHFEGVTRNAGGMTKDKWDLITSEGKILHELHPEMDPYWNPNLMIAYVQDNRFIAGMDMQTYKFPADPLPWSDSANDFERVLVFGDLSATARELHDHAALYHAEVWGNSLAITSPPMKNCGPWDIRRPDIAKEAFKRLSISRVVLTQLNEAPVQLLSFLRRLDLPVEYRPINAEAVCPRGNLIPNGQPCGSGYRKNQCQACMDEYSSPQGNVFIPAWLAEWARFTQSPVAVDLSCLRDPEYRDALGFVFAGERMEGQTN